MANTPEYLIARWQAELKELFDENDYRDVLDWLIANHDRKRVVLVGSGYSRNAKNPRAISIPLWTDISQSLAADLRVDHSTFDALSLADFYRRNLSDSSFSSE